MLSPIRESSRNHWFRIDPTSIRVLPPPGSIILFSGAQLHETVENTTDIARYSIDFRTVHLDDVRDKHGGVGVHSQCTGTTMRDYVRASDLAKLPDELVALYDDDGGDRECIEFWRQTCRSRNVYARRLIGEHIAS